MQHEPISLKKLPSRVTRKVRRMFGEPNPLAIIQKYRITSDDERDALARKATTDIAKLFFNHHGRIIHKWVHYLEIYERYLKPYVNTPVKMLEIGVFKGGSLDLWRKYLGQEATIFGIDIDPNCAERVTAPNQVRIGSQDDQDFLQKVVAEMGAPDIILDDGSHIAHHQRASFDILFPMLKEGGLYFIEDLHTAYWPGEWEGGYKKRGTAIEYIKQMIDDMHAWWHHHAVLTPAKDQIGAIHIFDSIVVIEKKKRPQPADIRIGQREARK